MSRLLRDRPFHVGLLACLAMSACGSDDMTAVGPCSAQTKTMPDEGEFHAPEGSMLTYLSNPPSSGTHYPVWGHWGVHQETLGRGYYVHNLEHGGIALLYNCTAPCPEIEAALKAVMDSRPSDSSCLSSIRHRMIMTADPLLDVPVAASAWTHTYRATCVDPETLNSFIDANYGHGPEDTCADGQVPF